MQTLCIRPTLKKTIESSVYASVLEISYTSTLRWLNRRNVTGQLIIYISLFKIWRSFGKERRNCWMQIFYWN